MTVPTSNPLFIPVPPQQPATLPIAIARNSQGQVVTPVPLAPAGTQTGRVNTLASVPLAQQSNVPPPTIGFQVVPGSVATTVILARPNPVPIVPAAVVIVQQNPPPPPVTVVQVARANPRANVPLSQQNPISPAVPLSRQNPVPAPHKR